MEFAGEFYQTSQKEEIIPVLHKDAVDSRPRNPLLLLQLSAGFSLPQTSSCSPPTGTGCSPVFSLHIPLRLYASFSKAKALSLAKIVILKLPPRCPGCRVRGAGEKAKLWERGPAKCLLSPLNSERRGQKMPCVTHQPCDFGRASTWALGVSCELGRWTAATSQGLLWGLRVKNLTCI